MKITLTVTKDELLQLLCKATGAALTDYVIVKETPATPLYKDVFNAMKKQFGTDYYTAPETGAFGPMHRKIEAIKHLRTIVAGLGLAEAKFAIEHWAKWIQWVKVKGSVPTPADIGVSLY